MEKSITITGSLGSGKSTIAKMLAQKLGYPYYSTGEAQREIAQKMGLTTLQLNHLSDKDPSIDVQIDGIFKKMNEDGKTYVVDSRLAWHFMPNSLKVKLEVSPTIAAERILNDQVRSGERRYRTLSEVMDETLSRRRSERSRFLKTYQVDIDDNSQFDLVVDTTDKTPEEICKIILENYNRK